MELDEAARVLGELAGRVPAAGGRILRVTQGAVQELHLDHAHAHNALTAEMMARLAAHVVALRTTDAALVVLRSATPGMFCAGGHLGQVRSSLVEPAAARAMALGMSATLDALTAVPAVVVAVVDGPAIGGGVELALAADVIVATSRASFELRQAKLGVAAGWGGARRLVERMGVSRAMAALVGARRWGAEELVRDGLAEVLLPTLADADAWVSELRTRPVAVLRACKRQARAADARAEAEAFLSVWGGPAHRRALGEGRPPEA